MRKVCVVVGSRANYGSIKSVMCAVQAHPELQLKIIVAASALLDRFGSVVDIIERDGFAPDARVNMIVEGETPVTMAKSTGLGLLELPTLFELLKPDVVVSAFAVSVMLMIYYTAVGFSVIYLTTVFNFSLKDANGLGNWNWGFNVIAVILIGCSPTACGSGNRSC